MRLSRERDCNQIPTALSLVSKAWKEYAERKNGDRLGRDTTAQAIPTDLGHCPFKSSISNMLLQYFQEEASMNAKLFKSFSMGHVVFPRHEGKDTKSNDSDYLQQIRARSTQSKNCGVASVPI